MVKINRFEDIQAWQKARELVLGVYQVTNKGNFAMDYGLKDQMRRASVSGMSNIAEGYARHTDKEFIHFLYITLGSVTEVQSQLYIAHDLNYISEEDFNKIYNIGSETARIITGFINYLKKVRSN